jgi:acyl-CoA reductase-like NAD-dependent aldehyde dehydrogenase
VYRQNEQQWRKLYCSKRIIAVESIADEFIEKFTAKLAADESGDPMDPSTELALK